MRIFGVLIALLSLGRELAIKKTETYIVFVLTGKDGLRIERKIPWRKENDGDRKLGNELENMYDDMKRSIQEKRWRDKYNAEM